MREHIEHLSVDIGARLAGSPEEQLAVDYLRAELESYGYTVRVQSFEAKPGPSSGLLRYTTLMAEGLPELRAVSLLGTPSGTTTAQLIDGGDGSTAPPNAQGAIVLFQRGDVTFQDMAASARDAGAAAVVIANKEPGLFPGILDPPVDISMAGIDQSDGEALRSLLARGPVDVTLNVRASVTAQNVIASPSSGLCETISGGHYDSVPWGPGANDNASGTAIVLELARAAAAAEIDGHCFVFFGAEELGLIGSKNFVSDLSAEELDGLDAMYNFDLAAADVQIELIGSESVVTQAAALAAEAGIDARPGRLPEGANSDHASFGREGVPALMLTTPDFDFIHTPQDTIETIVDQSLVDIADLGFALLEAG
jgi:aminopeptidase YwaD